MSNVQNEGNFREITYSVYTNEREKVIRKFLKNAYNIVSTKLTVNFQFHI